MCNIDVLKEEVHRAVARFYKAVEDLSIDEMEQIWAIQEPITCIHPGWNVLQGWLEIKESWQAIFQNTEYMEFILSDVRIEIEENMAWVICQENITQAIDSQTVRSTIISTNIFLHLDNQWLMVHHHGSPVFQPPGQE
jgi:ketosteroid isomerase-like protein